MPKELKGEVAVYPMVEVEMIEEDETETEESTETQVASNALGTSKHEIYCSLPISPIPNSINLFLFLGFNLF